MRVGRLLAALPTLTCAVLLGYPSTAGASTSTAPGRGGVAVNAVQCAYSSSNLAALRQDGIAPPAAIPSSVRVPIALPAGSAVYGVRFPFSKSTVGYTVGPAGYACSPEYAAADGGAAQYVDEAPGSALGISSVFDAGGAGPATDLACAYIPADLAADEVFRGGTGICSHPSGEQVLQIATGLSNRYVAAVEVPASVSDPDAPLFGSGKGNVAFALFSAQVSTGQANGQAVSCILPPQDKAICIAALEFFLISQSGVGKQMSGYALSSAEAAIANFVEPSRASVVATTLPTPRQAFSSVVRTVENVVITSVAIVFITFPAQMFNSTFDENYVEILAIWRRFLWRMGGRRRLAKKRRAQWAARGSTAPQETSRRKELVTFLSVLVAGSVIGGFRDPSFGFNLASVAIFTGTLLALALLIGAPTAAATAYRKMRRRPTKAKLRAVPAGIAIAVLSVLISRLADFQPGYLYGIVCGVAFAHKLAKKEEGHVVGVESAATLVVAAVAWIAFVPVDAAALHPGSSFWVALVDDWLASVFVGGIVGVTIGLLPLRFLPGGTLARWNRAAWASMFGIASFAVVAIMLRPSSGPARPGSAPLVTVIVLFVFFGGVSVAFRQYFAKRHPTGDGESRVTAPTGVERFR